MTADEFEEKWQKIIPKTENLSELWDWLEISGKQEEFKNDLFECLDYEKLINGWSAEA